MPGWLPGLLAWLTELRVEFSVSRQAVRTIAHIEVADDDDGPNEFLVVQEPDPQPVG